MLGSTPLVVALLLKCTPAAWLEKDYGKLKLVDESAEAKETGLVKVFNQAATMQVGGDGKDDDFKDPTAAEELAAKKNLKA